MMLWIRWTLPMLLVMAACADSRPLSTEPRAPAPAPAPELQPANAPPGASVPVTVAVPAALATPPFDVPRTLLVPPGFSIEVVARLSNARFIRKLPGGADFLVSRPQSGVITLVRPQPGAAPQLFTYASGLRRPHDMVLATVGGVRYLYIAEEHQVSRAVFTPGATTIGPLSVVVPNLPAGGGHPLKNIAIDQLGRLYVALASTCNVCIADVNSTPRRDAIYRYNADGSGGALFATGLRNAEGLAFVPNTNQLWAVVNHRDNTPYPFNDPSGNYGRVWSGYVDNHPPEPFTRVRLNGNYGWPFCNPNPDTPAGMTNMPYDIDFDMRSYGVDCSTMTPISRGIQAHSAPLGLLFLQGTPFPAAYQNGAVVALHGSWNRSTRTGYKVIHFSWDNATQSPTTQIDLVAGWLTIGGTVWGRPVDIGMAGDGGMLISDDLSGTIYKLK